MSAALFKSVCFPSVEAAKQAACSASAQVWGSGASTYSVECASTSFSGSTMDLCKRVDGGSCTMIQQPYPDFPACDFSGGSDLALDWLYAVLPVLAVLWGLKKLAGIFNTNNKED